MAEKGSSVLLCLQVDSLILVQIEIKLEIMMLEIHFMKQGHEKEVQDLALCEQSSKIRKMILLIFSQQQGSSLQQVVEIMQQVLGGPVQVLLVGMNDDTFVTLPESLGCGPLDGSQTGLHRKSVPNTNFVGQVFSCTQATVDRVCHPMTQTMLQDGLPSTRFEDGFSELTLESQVLICERTGLKQAAGYVHDAYIIHDPKGDKIYPYLTCQLSGHKTLQQLMTKLSIFFFEGNEEKSMGRNAQASELEVTSEDEKSLRYSCEETKCKSVGEVGQLTQLVTCCCFTPSHWVRSPPVGLSLCHRDDAISWFTTFLRNFPGRKSLDITFDVSSSGLCFADVDHFDTTSLLVICLDHAADSDDADRKESRDAENEADVAEIEDRINVTSIKRRVSYKERKTVIIWYCGQSRNEDGCSFLSRQSVCRDSFHLHAKRIDDKSSFHLQNPDHVGRLSSDDENYNFPWMESDDASSSDDQVFDIHTEPADGRDNSDYADPSTLAKQKDDGCTSDCHRSVYPDQQSGDGDGCDGLDSGHHASQHADSPGCDHDLFGEQSDEGNNSGNRYSDDHSEHHDDRDGCHYQCRQRDDTDSDDSYTGQNNSRGDCSYQGRQSLEEGCSDYHSNWCDDGHHNYFFSAQEDDSQHSVGEDHSDTRLEESSNAGLSDFSGMLGFSKNSADSASEQNNNEISGWKGEQQTQSKTELIYLTLPATRGFEEVSANIQQTSFLKTDDLLSSREFSGQKTKNENGNGNGLDIGNALCQFYGVSAYPVRDQTSVVAMMRAEHSVTPLHRGMEQEWNRLATFFQFNPPAGIFVIPIARAGFFLPANQQGQSNTQVKVECAFCGVAIMLERFISKAAMDVHMEASPGCRFVQRESVGNVSIAELAQTSAAQFMATYGSGGAGDSSDSDSASALQAPWPPHQPHPMGQQVDLATDADGSGAAIAGFAAAAPVLPMPSCNKSSQDSGLRETAPGSQQPSRPATAAHPSATQAPASSMATVSAGLPARNGIRPPSDNGPSSAGAANTPFQTARISQPPQSANSQPQTDSVTSEAPNRSGEADAAAAASAAQMASGGTAHVEVPDRANPPPAGEGNQNGREDNGQQRQLVTYEDLGIFSQQPKRPDMVVSTIRLGTFDGWPHEQSHPRGEMAEAGFYYTGHGDLVRCFHCKGGLKTWESSDKPWIEHCRWFPRCPFVRLSMGQKFVEAVQKLNNPDTRPTITMEEVWAEVRRMEEQERRNAAPGVVFSELVPQNGGQGDSLGALARAGLRVDADVVESSLEERAEVLEDENEELRDSTRCKMCQSRPVNILFLPCGHLVACSQCAPALRTCAICRQQVRGSVRVYLNERTSNDGPDNEDDDEDDLDPQPAGTT